MNVNMYGGDPYKLNTTTHPFGEDRRDFAKRNNIKGYFSHAGVDKSSMNGNLLKTVVIFSGIANRVDQHDIYGNFVEIKTKPSFIGGVDETFFTKYNHLAFISSKLSKGHFYKFGELIGTMGSTGLSIGVHLHFECRQVGIKANKKTLLLEEMQELLKFEDDVKNFFWQWGNLYINPLLMMDYFKFLQGD